MCLYLLTTCRFVFYNYDIQLLLIIMMKNTTWVLNAFARKPLNSEYILLIHRNLGSEKNF